MVQAFKMAIKNRNSHKELIHHFDRGLQYCSSIYQKGFVRKQSKTIYD